MMDGLSSLPGVATDSSSTLQNPGESRFRENRMMILHLAH